MIVADLVDTRALREAMAGRVAARLEALGITLPDGVVRALRTVPRHLFTGVVPAEEAYADTAVVTKRNERGVSLSSVSAPWLQAMMLAQAGLAPGGSVLEVGSGGYNAALIREVVGPAGSVASVDIDAEIAGRARACLAEAGYGDVELTCADAEFEVGGGRAFDAIIVTCGSWDVAPAWWSQLAPRGRLVVPLRTRGMTRSWALQRRGGALVSSGHMTCGFVPVQGAGAHRGRGVSLHDGDAVGLWLDEGEDVDEAALSGVLGLPRAEAWTGIAVGARALLGDLDLWLGTTLPGFCLMTASQEAIDNGVVALPWMYGTPAFADGKNLAYRARPRPADSAGEVFELGAVAHGPEAERSARLLAGQITAWDKAGRPAPSLSVHRRDTPDAGLPAGTVLDKKQSRLVISWPAAG
jgi:protein-L-isoaspartate(D-aspartate) O-methyltransferase